MSKESVLPQPLIVLSEALQPISRKLRTCLNKPPGQPQRVLDIVEFLSHHLDMIADNVNALADEVNSGLGEVISDADAPDADVYRAVARMEVHLDGLLGGYDEVRQASCSVADRKVWSLLWETYRAVLNKVQDFIDELTRCLDDPVTALEKRGLPTEGEVVLPIEFRLRAPPQLDELNRWIRQKTSELEAANEAEIRGQAEEEAVAGIGSNSLVSLLAAFGLGWFFGGDE